MGSLSYYRIEHLKDKHDSTAEAVATMAAELESLEAEAAAAERKAAGSA